MPEAALTLPAVTRRPEMLHYTVTLPSGDAVLFRPLRHDDAGPLGDFLASLSAETRRFWEQDGYDRAAARALCDAIGRYDKLRMVAEPHTPHPAHSTPHVIALFEFSFGLPEGVVERFRAYGISLSEETDARFGPCVRDELRGTGLADALMAPTLEVARRFGRARLSLWGGVFADNVRAVRFYARHGFVEAGRFRDDEGRECLDMNRDLG